MVNSEACSVDSCNMTAISAGLCRMHFTQAINGQDLHPRTYYSTHFGDPLGECMVAGCHKMQTTTGMGTCQSHAVHASKYGLHPMELVDLLNEPKCANPACGSTARPSIDHDHSCCPGASSCGNCVRAVLCGNCNSALGLLGDSVDMLLGLATYREANPRITRKQFTLEEILA